MKTKLIKDENLLQIYVDNYLLNAKNKTDVKYLENSKVRVFYIDNEENMIAGFCINSGPDYRTFLPLTPQQLQKIFRENGFDQKPPHEIACFWINKEWRQTYWVIYLAFYMCLDLLFLRSCSLIFGTHVESLKNFYSLAFPQIIFHEKVFVQTKGEECEFWIMKGTKFKFIKSFFILSTVRFIFGINALSRFRKWLGRNLSAN